MKSDRNSFMGAMPPFNSNFPANMVMFPNYLNDNYNNLDNKINSIEKKIKVLENRISRLESPYQNNMMKQPYSNTNQAELNPYQSTQNNNSYNGEMYMM